MPTENPRAEEVFAYFASLTPEERSYDAVAQRFAVNLPRWDAKRVFLVPC
jgi:hypothetical protein